MKMTVEHSLEEIAATPLHLSDKVHSNALRLEELILSSPFPPSRESEIVDRLKRQGQLVKLQRLYEAFETNLERNFARRLLEDDHVRETDYLLYGRFEKLIRNEIELAEIQSSDRVIFIGSGPFPISAILMSRLTGCAVHCYDKRLDFVKMSTEVVSKLGLSKDLQVSCQNGEEVDPRFYSVALVAILAKPKDLILKRIATQTGSHPRVICRTSSGIRQLLYETTDMSAYRDARIKRVIRATCDQTISSVLLEANRGETT